MEIYAKPNFTFNLMISTNAINQYYDDFLSSKKDSFEFDIDSQYYIFFQIQTQACQIGEIFRVEINR